MNKKIVTLSALALSLSMGGASLAYADHQCYSGKRMEKLVDSLDLTADQKAKIKTIRDQAMTAIKPKMDEMHAIHVKINESFKAGTLDDSTLDSLVSQKKEALGEIMKIRLTERRDISNVLTAPQKTKLADMLQQWEAKHEEGHDHD